jgi:hypothetical protein
LFAQERRQPFAAVFVDFFFAGAFEVFEGVIDPSVDGVPVVDDWLLVVPWFIVEELFTSVDVWFALVELETLWSPLPTFTPGLMFADALRSVLLIPTFAFTSTLGFTLSRLPDEDDEVVGDREPDVVDEVWPLVTPWFMFDVELVLLDVWFAFTLLEVEFVPVVEPLVPVLTPGLTFTPAFTFEFATPTLALTPTLGFTLVALDVVEFVPDVDEPLVIPLVEPMLLVVPDVLPEARDPLVEPVPDAIVPDERLPWRAVPLVDPAMEPWRAEFVTSVVLPAVVPAMPVDAVELPSGRQSMCTALAE